MIIEHVLKVDSTEKNIYYTTDAQAAIKLVNNAKYQVAFFLKPTTIKEVERIASSGWRMPHKSTYFYPKVLTGLVIYKLKASTYAKPACRTGRASVDRQSSKVRG